MRRRLATILVAPSLLIPVTSCADQRTAQRPAEASASSSASLLTAAEQAVLLPQLVTDLPVPQGTDWKSIAEATARNNGAVSEGTFRNMLAYTAKCLWDAEFLRSTRDAARRASATDNLRWYIRLPVFDFARDYYSTIYPATEPLQDSNVRAEYQVNCGTA